MRETNFLIESQKIVTDRQTDYFFFLSLSVDFLCFFQERIKQLLLLCLSNRTQLGRTFKKRDQSGVGNLNRLLQETREVSGI